MTDSTFWEKHDWQYILGKNSLTPHSEKKMIGSTFWEKNMIDSTFWVKNMICSTFWEKT
jgi:hypothetical protein